MKEIRDALAGVADTVGRNKQGQIVVRRGFFYRHGMDSEKFANRVRAALKAAGLGYLVLDQGEKYAAFRGGQTVAQGSHWWAVLG
jgi:hypothetical protein